MLKVLGRWINRYFGEEETVLLAVLLISALVVLITLGQIIAPFIAALIFAFLLQGGVNRLTLLGIPRIVAVISVFLFFNFKDTCFSFFKIKILHKYIFNNRFF